jgi:hypothetical protein
MLKLCWVFFWLVQITLVCFLMFLMLAMLSFIAHIQRWTSVSELLAVASCAADFDIPVDFPSMEQLLLVEHLLFIDCQRARSDGGGGRRGRWLHRRQRQQPSRVKLLENVQNRVTGLKNCWHEAYRMLFASCGDIMADKEKQSWLAWHLSSCFQEDSGRPSLLSCSKASKMVHCREMNFSQCSLPRDELQLVVHWQRFLNPCWDQNINICFFVRHINICLTEI